jgi:NLS-binding and DNA-binding and dimerisation domains of Nrf1
MPLNADEEDEESIQNMVSNLPLLFANGYPSTLDKITEKQLEKFIPFMVQCSLGNLQYQTCFEHNEPEWWPEDLEFVHPFAKPKGFVGVSNLKIIRSNVEILSNIFL